MTIPITAAAETPMIIIYIFMCVSSPVLGVVGVGVDGVGVDGVGVAGVLAS
jgi:hypothetical protein